jgi:hypothetical protein
MKKKFTWKITKAASKIFADHTESCLLMREKEDKGANQIKCPEFLEITTSKSQNMTLKEHFYGI